MKLLSPYVSEKVWGYENWIVSNIENKESTYTIDEKEYPVSTITGGKYPLLIKLIQTYENLSVQVHPDDDYALKNENSVGKTECWYILDAKPGTHLITGLKNILDVEALKKAIHDDTIEDYLFETPVKKGDLIFIPAGTVHAIKGGMRILEVQQSCVITYRLYDWKRKSRELHLKKSLDVIRPIHSVPVNDFNSTFSCEYFKIEKINISGTAEIKTDPQNFTAVFIVSGNVSLQTSEQEMSVQEESLVFLEPDKTIKCTCTGKTGTAEIIVINVA